MSNPAYILKANESGKGFAVNVQGRDWGFVYPDQNGTWSAFPNYAQGGAQRPTCDAAVEYVLAYYPASPAEIRRLRLDLAAKEG